MPSPRREASGRERRQRRAPDRKYPARSSSAQRDERWRAAQQRLVCLPVAARVERLEELHLAAGEQRDRQPVAIEQAIAGQRRQLRPRRQDAGEVERVGAGERDEGLRRRAAADLAQEADGVGQGELLAREAGDEAAAAYVAARLEPAIDAQEVAPRRQPGRLALEQTPEDDAVAAQQGMREMLDRRAFGRRERKLAPREGPTPGIGDAEGAAAP